MIQPKTTQGNFISGSDCVMRDGCDGLTAKTVNFSKLKMTFHKGVLQNLPSLPSLYDTENRL